MENAGSLHGQYALVTGASRGIGRAIAESLAGAGCNVAVTSRSLADCRAGAAELEEAYGVHAVGLQGDVSRFEDVRRLFGELQAWSSGRLDVLVCNAGYPLRPEIWNTPLHATPAEKLPSWYLDIFGTDAMGAVYCTYQALAVMTARHYGSVIYISSTPALEGFQGTAYTMAKAAILGLMKDIAREYGKDNIRANALALGNISSEATFNQLDEAARRELAAEAPLRRWGKIEEVGRAALFLASGQSSFITGQVLVVDGGTLRR